jgi:uncharacterized membrane protein
MHLTCSVGWIGAVVAYLVLVVTAMIRQDNQTVRTAWIAMAWIGWAALVPLALAALLTGLIMALGTRWGLFRHYWVIFSLVLTILAAGILIEHMPTVSFFATMAIETNQGNIEGLKGELLHAGGGLLVLLVIQILNMYKPRGMTRYGWESSTSSASCHNPSHTNPVRFNQSDKPKGHETL